MRALLYKWSPSPAGSLHLVHGSPVNSSEIALVRATPHELRNALSIEPTIFSLKEIVFKLLLFTIKNTGSSL